MNEYITKNQWNQLNEEQKNIFKEDMCEENYPNNYLPEYSEILRYLNNHEYKNLGFEYLKDFDTPKGPPLTIDKLWEIVLKFFNKKYFT